MFSHRRCPPWLVSASPRLLSHDLPLSRERRTRSSRYLGLPAARRLQWLVRPHDIGSPRSLVPIVTENLREPLTALGDPQRQHSPLVTCPGGSQCIPASGPQG